MLWTWVTTTLLVVFFALVSMIQEVPETSTTADLIDCKYENPELHIYMDELGICSP